MSGVSEDKSLGNVREEGTHISPAALKVLRSMEDWKEPSLAHLHLCPSVSPWHAELYPEAVRGFEQVQITSYDPLQ